MAGIDYDVTPEPTDAEREALEAVLAEPSEVPEAYASPWRRAALVEDDVA